MNKNGTGTEGLNSQQRYEVSHKNSIDSLELTYFHYQIK